jgi:hypothetical protein
MNQELIIELAFKAGFVEYELDDGTTAAFDKRYEKFAALVAAAEREACAKVCDQLDEDFEGPDTWDWHSKDYAAAIRARGETK